MHLCVCICYMLFFLIIWLTIYIFIIKFVFNLKLEMSTFQWNKPYSKFLCESNVMIKNSEQRLFFSIIFKVIWSLLSYDYFQTIVNSLISLGWHILNSSLGPGTKIYTWIQNEVPTHMLKFLHNFNTTYNHFFF